MNANAKAIRPRLCWPSSSLRMASGLWLWIVCVWLGGAGASAADAGTNVLWWRASHSGPVNSVAASPDGTQVASASDDGTVKLCRYSDAAILANFRTGSEQATTVAFTPDNLTLVG